jgi:hypothetical protein
VWIRKKLLQIGCLYRLIKYRSKFREVILLLEGYGNHNWTAGVHFDNERQLFLGYISIDGGMYSPNTVRLNLHKMRWFKEREKYSEYTWKTILD